MTTALIDDMNLKLDFTEWCESQREPKEKVPCKGLFYRVQVSQFCDCNGAIHHRTSFRPLKRMSCQGCEQCGYMMDDAQERNWEINYSTSIGHGDLVMLKVTNISHDWETGYVDDWDLEFVKVLESKG